MSCFSNDYLVKVWTQKVFPVWLPYIVRSKCILAVVLHTAGKLIIDKSKTVKEQKKSIIKCSQTLNLEITKKIY